MRMGSQEATRYYVSSSNSALIPGSDRKNNPKITAKSPTRTTKQEFCQTLRTDGLDEML